MTLEKNAFPFPFKDNHYRYSNNSVPLDPPVSIEITPTYQQEVRLKRELLTNHPERCYQSLPHTLEAQWELVNLILHHLVATYPHYFHLEKKGEVWTFSNKILEETRTFVFGDPTSLEEEPLDFVGRHVQEDLLLIMQRDDELYLEAGQLCFPANWSLHFDLGMTFKEIHRPIPGFKESQLDTRIRQFLMRLEAGHPWTRKNWSLMPTDRLDTSLEAFSEWGKAKQMVTEDNVGEKVNLRVEVQKLFRLPKSQGILFSIHTHLMPLSELVKDTQQLNRAYSVIKELPQSIADYKGISPFREPVQHFLEKNVKKGSQDAIPLSP